MTRPKLFQTFGSLAFFVLASVVIATPSHAGGTCTYDASTNTVHASTMGDGFVALRRRNSEIVFKVSGTPGYESCDGATVHNTDSVEYVDKPSGYGYLIISQSHGSFVPGATPEEDGVSEIEFSVETQYGLYVYGTPESDLIVGGKHGLRLTRDRDIDVQGEGLGRGHIVYGGEGDDEIFLDGRGGTGLFDPADSHRHFLWGGPGDDHLVGGSDPDTIWSGAGDDLIAGSEGRNEIVTGAGQDRIIGGPDSEEIHGGEGSDYVQGGTGDDSIRGHEGGDRLKGGPGSDTIFGWTKDKSKLNRTDGADTIWGQEGHDVLRGDGGDDHIIAGAGDDAIEGTSGDDELEGGAGDDEIFGDRGDDHLDGDAGRDKCDPGLGEDTKEDCER